MSESPSSPLPIPAPPTGWAPAPVDRGSAGFNWGDFFAFRYMITPVIIKVIYVIGAGLISLVSIMAIVSPSSSSGGILVGVLAFLLGNLYWRVIAELLIVFFGMHESLRSIERQDRG